MSDCSHEQFGACVNVNRIADGDADNPIAYVCEVRVQCAQCGQEFQFVCPDVGLMTDRPAVSADGKELRCYLKPSDGSLADPIKSMPGFGIKRHRPGPSQN